MFGWLKRLFQARHSTRWIRSEHEEERLTAIRLGLFVKAQEILPTRQLYLMVTAPDQGKVGALMLRGRDEKVVLHRSTKNIGGWQASWIKDEGLIGNDRQYKRLQEGLDRLREKGYVVHSLMTRSGELRE